MYQEETIKYLADNLELIAEGLLNECDPADIRLMFEEETEMENIPEHAGKTFVDLFREAAAKYPDRPAVRDEFGDFTYRELDKMSDYVAQRLTENGFGPEQGNRYPVRRTRNMHRLCRCYESRRSLCSSGSGIPPEQN